MYSITRDRSALIAVRINKFCRFLRTRDTNSVTQTHDYILKSCGGFVSFLLTLPYITIYVM